MAYVLFFTFAGLFSPTSQLLPEQSLTEQLTSDYWPRISIIRWYDWYTARSACQQLNADLVSIHDANENDFVAELARASVVFNATGQAWTGLFMAKHNIWEWTDETDVGYAPFLVGHVIGSGNCGMLVADDMTDVANARLSWIPTDCSMKLRTAICKYSPSAR